MKNPLYKILDWDSNAFGYNVANILIKSNNCNNLIDLKKKLKKEHIKLAYWFVNPLDDLLNKKAIEFGFKLVDEKQTFQRIISPDESFFYPNEVKEFHKKTISKNLFQIAIQSSIYSRFRLDESFENNEYLTLYNLWIENSVNKTIATDVFVFIEDKKELGLLTLKISDEIGTIGLFSVDEKSRGKSVGKKLMQTVFFKLFEQKIEKLNVVTQKANKIACNFYSSQGFNLIDTTNVYHLWI